MARPLCIPSHTPIVKSGTLTRRVPALRFPASASSESVAKSARRGSGNTGQAAGAKPRLHPSFLRRQESPHTPTSPNSCYAHTRTEVPNHAPLPATTPTRPPHRRRQPQPRQRLPKTCHCQPLQHTLNNPEQIRTNLNIAERPDQIGRPPESPPITPKKTKT